MKTRAFSLIELLVVMGILILLMTFAIPAFNSITVGSNLNRAGLMIGDEIALARQEAVSKNRDVQVVLYKLPTGTTSAWRGIRLLRIDQTPAGMVTNAASRLLQIPEGVLISPDAAYSPLLTSAVNDTVTLPGYGTVQCASFRFRANGSLESRISSASNFLTLQSVTATGNPPANYYTIQVNTLTGKLSVFRP